MRWWWVGDDAHCQRVEPIPLRIIADREDATILAENGPSKSIDFVEFSPESFEVAFIDDLVG